MVSILGIIGLVLLVAGASVMAIGGSVIVTGTVNVTGVATVCTASAGGIYTCVTSWTVNLAGVTCPTGPFQCTAELYVYLGATECSHFTCSSGFYYYNAIALTGQEGNSVKLSQTFQGLGPVSTVSIFVQDSNGNQASQAVFSQFSPGGSGWSLNMEAPQASDGQAVAKTCVTPAVGQGSYAIGAAVTVTASDPCTTLVTGSSWEIVSHFQNFQVYKSASGSQGDESFVKEVDTSSFRLTMDNNYFIYTDYGPGTWQCVPGTSVCSQPPVTWKWYAPATIDISIMPSYGFIITSGSQTILGTSQPGLVALTAGQSATFTITVPAGYSLSGWGGWVVYYTGSTVAGAAQNVAGTTTSFTLSYSQLLPYVNDTGCSNCASSTGSANPASYSAFELEALQGSSGTNVAPVLTINSSPGGTTSPVAGTYRETVGQQVPITETTSAGYCFADWSVDGSPAGNASSITVTMGNYGTGKEVMPEWTAKINGVCVPNGSPFLEILQTVGVTFTPAAGTYPETYGKVVQVSYSLQSGYEFCDWVVNGFNAGTQNPVSVTMGNGINTITADVMSTAAGPCLGSSDGYGASLSSSFWYGLGLACVGGVAALWDVTKNPPGKKMKVKVG